MAGIWDVWSTVIKKAKGHALLLTITCLFLLSIAIFARTGNQVLDYAIIFCSTILGFGALLLILISINTTSQPSVKRKYKPKKKPGTLATPTERPFREKVKDAREVVKLFKDINDLDDS